MDIQPSEISKILKEEIKNFGSESEILEVGQVLSVGDGIARIYGLDNVQAGEMVEFSDGTKAVIANAILNYISCHTLILYTHTYCRSSSLDLDHDSTQKIIRSC